MNAARRVAGLWRRLTGPVHEFGIGAGSVYICDRLLRKLWPGSGLYLYEFMAQPVPEAPLLPAGLSRNLSARLIGPGDADVRRMPAREDIKAQRFAQGAWCVGTCKNDELLGYVWFCSPRYDEDEVRCTYVLPPDGRGVFDFDLYVMPERRMGIAFSALWHIAFHHLRQRGVQYSFSRMTRFNTASRRAHLRLGAICVGRAFFMRLGQVELMISTLAPRVALTWSRKRVSLRMPLPGPGVHSNNGTSP